MYFAQRPDLIFYSALAVAVAGALVIFSGTPWGLGLSPDSFAYLRAARLLSEGASFSSLPSHWPPGYPILLAALNAITGDLLRGSRVLQSLLFFLNLMLFWFLIGRLSGRTAIGVLFLLLLALQPAIIHVHLLMWTEPAFLTLIFLNLILLIRVIEHPEGWRFRWGLALVAGLAVMVRYAGLFLVGANAVALLALQADEKWAARIVDAFLISMLSLIPMAAWTLFNFSRGIGATNRSVVFHPPGWSVFEEFRGSLAGWLHLPDELGWVVVVGVLGLTMWQFFSKRETTAVLARVLAIYVLFYFCFLYFSLSFVDAYTPLDNRILLPILPPLVLLVVYATRQTREDARTLVLAGAIMTGLVLNVQDSVRLWMESRKDGLGFASQGLQQIPLMHYLRGLPSSWKFATNGPELFELYLRQKGDMLPKMWDTASQRDNAEFGAQMAELAGEYSGLCFFASIGFRSYLPDPKALNDIEGFRLVYAQEDGFVWINQRVSQD